MFGFEVEENSEGTISVNQVKQEPKEPALSLEAKPNLTVRNCLLHKLLKLFRIYNSGDF